MSDTSGLKITSTEDWTFIQAKMPVHFDEFMLMGRARMDYCPQDLIFYKNTHTRRYLIIDITGQCWHKEKRVTDMEAMYYAYYLDD